ncbi:hypothetical protein [Croceicoccus naphthovorans]|uniref:Uncharacterized protein n=1 Tax=Croceicoccus naphthovorans TaxID=1348774 RepID=A0A0G3XF32_9SPHN|nr:hypothetical protein [Croceicoccus naphthovorans]AKM08998.1 hypothetical protein AB433_01855 [Croceicoccus naphthovorans]MBB3989188.1 hypothetical protein [Croceicoccus naphthovorans]
MQFDDLMLRYFGTNDMNAIAPGGREAGIDRMRVDFGLERDPAKRFVIWALLAMNDAEPDLSEAFETEAEREAARNLLDLVIMAKGGD